MVEMAMPLFSGVLEYTHTVNNGNHSLSGMGSNGKFKAVESGSVATFSINDVSYSVKQGSANSVELITGLWYTFILDGTNINFVDEPIGKHAVTLADAAQSAADTGIVNAAAAKTAADNAQSAANSAQSKADAAMPKTGDAFTGNVIAYNTNRTGFNLRNVCVYDSAWSVEQSTSRIVMLRK